MLSKLLRGWTVRQVAERLIAFALMVVLCRSVMAHLANPYYYLQSVYAYRYLTIELSTLAAAVLPTLQAVLTVCLALRWWLRATYILSTATFTLFATVQASAVYRGLEISCGCFGAADSVQVGWETISVAVACLLLSLLGAVLAPEESAYLSKPTSEQQT